MDSISRVNQVIETLRRQMAETAQKLDSSASSRTGTRGTSSPSAGAVNLRAQIQERIRAIDPLDPQLKKRARRVFLESVITQEFGTEILMDQQFTDMLDYVENVLASSPELNLRFDQLIKDLSNP